MLATQNMKCSEKKYKNEKYQTRDFKPSIYIASSLDQDEELVVLQRKFSLSPEQPLAHGKWRKMLRSDVYQEGMVGFAVDEALGRSILTTVNLVSDLFLGLPWLLQY